MKRHINEFVKLKCAPDLLGLGLFPNAKEITESMAAYRAVFWGLLRDKAKELGDPTVAVVAVGDGCVPRTAALFAFRSNWQCFSVDPAMKRTDWNIKRLQVFDCKIEEFNLNCSCFSAVILVLVHSHATVRASLDRITGTVRHVVAIPCCVPHELPGKPYTGYEDYGIWSPKRTVKIWRNV
jgi:hypothetical protein